MKALGIDERSFSPGRPDSFARANMYGFLSAVFLRPPEPGLLHCVSQNELLKELSMLAGRSDAKDLETSLFDEPGGNDPEAVKQEYMNLFAVPTGRYVFPFEDVYRGTLKDGPVERKGPLLGPCAVAVKTLYRQAGAQLDPACRELPTHIGVELGFMSFLCHREAEAQAGSLLNEPPCCLLDEVNADLNESRRLQLVFLTEHLNEWFPQLSKSIQANASKPFYRSLASLTEQILSWDTTSLFEASQCETE
jgi:putative dimethyl sulfoxide reductase chaperone